jgi:Insertion element 4 transposase N-terminal
MPRAGQVKPTVVERLSDRLAIGVLTSTYPPELVDQVVAEAGRTQQPERLLPARVVVWLVLAMALFSGQASEEVARLLAGGLGSGQTLAAVVPGPVHASDRQGQGPAGARAPAAAVC